jgi:hypothetical protein
MTTCTRSCAKGEPEPENPTTARDGASIPFT